MKGRETSKAASIAIIAVCQVAAMALWFSASAVIPALVAEFGLSGFSQAALTSGVQAGFVLGCLASALLGLADRVDPRRLFAACACVGAAANALLLVVDPASPGAPLLRVVTGACMAGIYPVGMKLASTWAKGDMGLMVGILVGALTLGSASPHLFNAIGGVDWRIPLAASSASALFAAGLIGFAGMGPNRAPAPRFDPAAALTAWRDKPLRLANLGYLGHMWELYAMWAWIGVFFSASFALRFPPDVAPLAAKLAAFATIAAGALGSVGAGLLADRLGRTTLTIAAMTVSGI
jgi:MFS family permease